ncbi:MAG: low molecular weight phosphotyrosine protein phosphatase [Candidatus Nitronauta litoralis]|uniref:protein-tyrosine-phosphatase n=1 Tax=Candidatus Nitronauta litoralis TaxID=2705533 RepID=A0A7T0FZP7_9BACT|nr:MAG: low molecular weight phosphotyrosine protein phosphatase [Candidatus Nitronauta litoralis]
MTSETTVTICFVCLGNICRSPLAEGVFQDLLKKEGLEERIIVHSAGTGNWHVGARPDKRMQSTANARGIELLSTAEQFQPGDFKRFDLVLAMDQSNKESLDYMGSGKVTKNKLKMFREFDPDHNGDFDVPDPYYGGDQGFETVFDIVNRTCPPLLEYIKRELL